MKAFTEEEKEIIKRYLSAGGCSGCKHALQGEHSMVCGITRDYIYPPAMNLCPIAHKETE